MPGLHCNCIKWNRPPQAFTKVPVWWTWMSSNTDHHICLFFLTQKDGFWVFLIPNESSLTFDPDFKNKHSATSSDLPVWWSNDLSVILLCPDDWVRKTCEKGRSPTWPTWPNNSRISKRFHIWFVQSGNMWTIENQTNIMYNMGVYDGITSDRQWGVIRNM